MTLLMLDNYDSFTYMLVDYLRQAGATCVVRRNDEPLAALLNQPVDGVVLSPGPGTPAEAGHLMDVVAHYHQRVPMLGVCLGHQALGTFFGAELTQAERPLHGKTSLISADTTDPLFAGLPGRFRVTHYHSLVLHRLPPGLQPLARTDAGVLMALRHRQWPLWGVQYHPEAVLTDFGVETLKNWIKYVNFSTNRPTDGSVQMTTC